ncbi:MAG: tetratricopeptide repeat protein [Brevefilum sp.]
MSLTGWLDLIRQRFSPEHGQILVQSLQQDPLVWQFIQDESTSRPFFESAPAALDAYTPGKMAAWWIKQKTGSSLTEIGQGTFTLSGQLKAVAAQAFETTFNTGLPPADLYTAGLLALTLHERRMRKDTWEGLSDEIFILRNQQSIVKNYRTWQTPFACLFDYCPDFADLSADFTTSSSPTTQEAFIPIHLHTLIANPMAPSQLMEQLFGFVKQLSIDLQLESLRWLRDFRQQAVTVQLAKQLLQTKENRDFIARVFSALETFDAVNPEIDPLEKYVQHALPEDINRLAAFYFFCGDTRKANETYQKSSDVLEFLKAQTLYQSLVGERKHTSPSRWLEIINAVPHSKQARLFYAQSLIANQQYKEAQTQLEELPQTIQRQLLLNQIPGEKQTPLSTLLSSNTSPIKLTEGKSNPQASYFVQPSQLPAHTQLINAIRTQANPEESLPWLEKYLSVNMNDLKAIRLTRDLYEKANRDEQAIELTAFLERIEPNDFIHKRNLARLLAKADRWQDAFAFLQTIVKSDSKTDVIDLEMFAEAAVRTSQTETAMSICQNILRRSPNNPKALVLLGEIYHQKGDVLKAIQHMEGVVESVPNEPDAWITLAWLWAENDQTDRALETLKKGNQFNPDQPQLLRALGKAQVEKQAFSEALTALKQAHTLDPDHLEGKVALASVYQKMGQAENAYRLLESFTRNFEQHPHAAKLLGHVLLALDRSGEAEPILLFVAQQFPEEIETVLAASQLVLDRLESEHEPEPKDILQKVQALLKYTSQVHPEQAEISRLLADIDRQAGQHQKAFEVYSRLAKETTESKTTADWRLKYGLGQAAMGLGNLEVGLAALQAALGIQPSSLIIRHALADALQTADLPGKANAMATSALRMAPQDLNNILWYAKFKTDTNDPDEAVRAIKEALQITPHRDELRLWLAKTLIASGASQEAHENISAFVHSSSTNPELFHQACYICVHLNDLDLAAQALEKVRQTKQDFSPVALMDLAIIYSLKGQHQKALEILNADHNSIAAFPQIAILKADLLGDLGQYDSAHTTLKDIEGFVGQHLADEGEKTKQFRGSPLLYSHDLSLNGYQIRLGQLSRALGLFQEAHQHFSAALEENPYDEKLINAFIESAMVGLNHQPALNLPEHINPSSPLDDNTSQDLLDLICSQVEILIYQEDYDKAADRLEKIAAMGAAYPRYLAIQSRLQALLGETDKASNLLEDAIITFNETFGSQPSRALPTIFRQIINLHSIAEAYLASGNHLQAIHTWSKVSDQLDNQPLMNWRYLYALVTGAEAQQIAGTLSITAHSPGAVCLSEDHYRDAERLLTDLQKVLPQDQLVCLKARIESAFIGTWPTHLNIDACLQGPEEAAAVLIGSEEENLVQDILETYSDEVQVLQAYGVYAIRRQKRDAIPYVENALSLDPANPINHALLAHLTLNQPEIALKSIETALSLWPEEPEWHAIAADLNNSLGQTANAQRHIEFALEKQPENAKFWQKSAKLKVQNNNFAQAKSDLEMSTAYQPQDPSAWAAMAEVNRRMGDLSDALENIRKASQLDPADQKLVEMDMKLLFDKRNYLELETRAKSILAADNTQETARIFLAHALAKQGKFDQALDTLSQTLKQDPDNVVLSLEYCKIKKDQAGVEKVLPELIELAQNNTHDPEVLTTLTDWLIQANRLDEAEKAAQTVLRIMPEQAEIHLMLGRLQRAKGKLDQAITHLSEAISLDPAFIEAYLELGKTYQERRDLEKAIQIFEKASQANRSDPRPYYYAGLALKEIKDYPGAEVMLKQAKRCSPDDANIIRQLGVVTALNLVNNLREAK